MPSVSVPGPKRGCHKAFSENFFNSKNYMLKNLVLSRYCMPVVKKKLILCLSLSRGKGDLPDRCADKQGPHPSTCPLLKPRQPQTVSLKHPGGCPAGARRAAASPALRRDRGSMRHHLSNHSQPADISLISGIVIRLQRRKKYVREPPSAHAGQTPAGLPDTDAAFPVPSTA